MPTLRNKKGRSLSRVAGIGAALAVIATAMTAAPALAGRLAKTPATVTLSSSVPGLGLVTGQAVAFTATVTTSGAPATGNIIFGVVGSEGQVATCDGGKIQPLSTTAGVTTATCSFAKGLLGKPLFYNVSAHLADPNYSGSATLVQLIDKSLTDTTISGLPGSVKAGEAFSFTATVQDVSPGTGSPTGSMEFAICPFNQPTCTGGPGGVFGMAPPTASDEANNENKITFSLPSGVLTPGFYDVSADYVGDSNYWSSQSNFSFLLVTKVPTTLNRVASANPTYNGGREVLRAVIKGVSQNESLGAPTGTVTYTITGRSGDTLVCQENGTDVIPVSTKPANQGVTRCTVTGDVVASDSPYIWTAVYSGDSVYNGSSGTGTLRVTDHP